MNVRPGAELKKLREEKGITLAQAAEATCMRESVLRGLEESAPDDLLPDVYQKLSLRMYARYLGMEVEVTRRAAQTAGGVRIAPVGLLRRMSRAPKAAKLDPAQRSRLLTVAKTTSAAIVTVLAVGLWSLNAKISRLHFDDKPGSNPDPILAPEPAVQAPPTDLFPAPSAVADLGLPAAPMPAPPEPAPAGPAIQ